MGTLSIGIIILEDYIADPLTGIIKVGRRNKLAKHINKVSFRQAIVSIGHRRSFRYYKLINK